MSFARSHSTWSSPRIEKNQDAKKTHVVSECRDKKVNSSGLQRADFVACPIGISVLRPGQDNRAFEVLS